MKPTTLSRRIAAQPDDAMRTVIDIHRLPEWNRAITRVLDAPKELSPGSEWVVEVKAFGRTWPSRSRLETLDLDARRFSYRSCSDDGNPSYAVWTWAITEQPGGCEVSVTLDLHPKTFWRRLLLARVRQHQLTHTEMSVSLAALASAVTPVAASD